MQLTVTERRSMRRFSVLWSLFLMMAVGLTSTALASCGDYLVHGKLVHLEHSPGTSRPVAALVIPLSIFRTESSGSSVPKSACEGGRCQSMPVPPPVDSTRISVPKHSATVVKIDKSNSGNDSKWGRPCDGFVIDQPFLDIASPPPRCLLFCA